MNRLEDQLDYCLGREAPPLGRAFDVATGIRWARMRLPFVLDHINVWLLRDELPDDKGGAPRQGWTIVDCGIADEATRGAWEQLFAEALDGLPVLRVIVTHMHPDHIGSAAWLCERWGVRLWISATDYTVARRLTMVGAGDGGGPMSAGFMAAHGLVEAESAPAVGARGANYYRTLVPAVPAAFHRLLDGMTVQTGSGDARRSWRCLAGYGHAPEHMALVDARGGVVISGDMILPRISTNISVIDVEPESDPLALYLDSIEKMRAIDADALVLPSHGLPFKGLHTRIDQLQAHHADRLADVVAACRREPQSAFDLVPVLFSRRLDPHQMTFAMGESVAHLHKLWSEGALDRRRGDDGVYRFAAA